MTPIAPLSNASPHLKKQITTSATAMPSPTELTPGEGTFPDPGGVDRADVEATAETAAAIRAKPLMSQEWAANQIEPERNGNQAAWLEPAEHQAYSGPSLIPAVGDVSRDVAADKAIRAYDLTWRWISRDDHQIEATGQRHVTIYLEKHNGQWDVIGHQSSDLPQ